MSKIEYIYFDFVNLSHYSIGREINQMQQIIRRLSVFSRRALEQPKQDA